MSLFAQIRKMGNEGGGISQSNFLQCLVSEDGLNLNDDKMTECIDHIEGKQLVKGSTLVMVSSRKLVKGSTLVT